MRQIILPDHRVFARIRASASAPHSTARSLCPLISTHAGLGARQRDGQKIAEDRMMLRRKGAVALACAAAVLATSAAAQQPAAPENPGRAVVAAKCFQCHTDSMFRDARQDRRAWEAAIYRMIGRGGLWPAEEIKLMADYLGSEFGPKRE
jgi:mono/diheme cytochrome c family protein